MNLSRAFNLANQLLETLAPRCGRIAIAGGIARGKSDVHDIELVAIPRMVPEQGNFFSGIDFPDESPTMISDLENFDWSQIGRVLKGGDRYKQIEITVDLETDEKINLDLFIVLPPAQWGVIKAIRTGPADYSHWLVTPKRAGGAMPSHLKQRDGSLWNGAKQILTPEEDDYFKALGLAWKPPNERRAPREFENKVKK